MLHHRAVLKGSDTIHILELMRDIWCGEVIELWLVAAGCQTVVEGGREGGREGGGRNRLL